MREAMYWSSWADSLGALAARQQPLAAQLDAHLVRPSACSVAEATLARESLVGQGFGAPT